MWNGDRLCVLERCYPCGEGFLAREVSPHVERRGGPPSRRMRGVVVAASPAALPNDSPP